MQSTNTQTAGRFVKHGARSTSLGGRKTCDAERSPGAAATAHAPGGAPGRANGKAPNTACLRAEGTGRDRYEDRHVGVAGLFLPAPRPGLLDCADELEGVLRKGWPNEPGNRWKRDSRRCGMSSENTRRPRRSSSRRSAADFEFATDRNPHSPESRTAERFKKLAPGRESLRDHLAGDEFLIDGGTVRFHNQEQSAPLPTIELDADASVRIVVHCRSVVRPAGQLAEQRASLGDHLAGGGRPIHFHALPDLFEFPERFRKPARFRRIRSWNPWQRSVPAPGSFGALGNVSRHSAAARYREAPGRPLRLHSTPATGRVRIRPHRSDSFESSARPQPGAGRRETQSPLWRVGPWASDMSHFFGVIWCRRRGGPGPRRPGSTDRAPGPPAPEVEALGGPGNAAPLDLDRPAPHTRP